ncbi:MAG TPA: hypothetical protein VGB46_09405 [Flavisolibacter sp.]|jgi:hypothetical protein
MRYIYAAILLSLSYHPVLAQDGGGRAFLQTNNKMHLYYVDLDNSAAIVYDMGKYLDKAGMGYSIRETDTLVRQPGGSYSGSTSRIIRENNRLYLVSGDKKARKFRIDTVRSLTDFNNNLNNAYFLDSYSRMSRELNQAYPLYHHSFRDGFHTWKELLNKEIDYLQFREFADNRIRNIRDSISRLQDSRTALTNYIIQNINTLEYNTLKDSLAKLPPEYAYQSSYYRTVINAAATQRPEYFFRLAEEFPAHRHLIFSSVENNKEVLSRMKAVEGHDKIKKEFFKERKFEKSIPYRVIGAYAALAGLITLLIVTQ